MNADSVRVEQKRWEMREALFSVEHMMRRVRDSASEHEMHQTLKALDLMEQYHEGQFRKGKDHVPYIFHPLMMACHAFALGIAEDELVAACLLHDVLEDCDVSPERLDVSENIIEAVKLVSFCDIEGLSHEESKAVYYEKIRGNRYASMVKLLDRCNNISTMATAFSTEKMASYIDETEKYIIPILDHVKHTYHEYYNATFLLKYQMRSIMETLKRLLSNVL